MRSLIWLPIIKAAFRISKGRFMGGKFLKGNGQQPDFQHLKFQSALFFLLMNSYITTIISMVNLMQECSPKHLHMGTARMKEGDQTEEKDKHKIVNIESKVDTKKMPICQPFPRGRYYPSSGWIT